jgi:predicted dehydrogenase
MSGVLNRRDFMRRSVVGAAVVPAAQRSVGWALTAGGTAANDRIAVGIIGVGARVQSDLLQAAMAAPGVEIVGVCDAYKGRIERAIERTNGRAKEYPDYRALLADKSIDAVIIGTPDHLHKPQTLAAFEAGKDVYLEKPMTFSISEGPEMIAAASRTKRILQVGSQGISSKLQETVREIVQSGRLGQVTLIRASFNRNTGSGAWLYPIPPDANEKTVSWEAFLGSAPKRPFSLERFFRWRCYWDYSGGISTDLFVHLMTTIHFVMNAKMPEMVVGLGANYRHKTTHEVPDTIDGLLRYPEGFSVNLSSTFNNESASQSGVEILGHEASLAFRGGQLVFRPEHNRESNAWIVSSWPKALEEAYWADPKVKAAELADSWAPRMARQSEVSVEEGQDSTFIHMARFFDSVRTRKPSVEDGSVGHHAAAVAHMVNESVRKGHAIEWDFGRDVTKAA